MPDNVSVKENVSDKALQQAVLRELEYEPQVKSTEIGVSVKDGIVTLTGFIDSYSKKYHAERAALRVYGVKAVVNDIEVKLPASSERTDEEIARAAVQALSSRLTVPVDRVKVTVRNGWITLEGEVEWQFQKDAADDAVRHLIGVKRVTNRVTLQPHLSPAAIQAQIEEALRRSAEVDARRITVEVEGSKVRLRGTVRSWVEREEAERAAWRAPGVAEVENLITVAP